MRALLPLLALFAAACSNGGDEPADTDPTETDDTTETDADTTDTDSPPEETDLPVDDGSYTFVSRFDGQSSVAYSGQTFRLLLIEDMRKHLEGMTARLDGSFDPDPGEVAEELEFYFSFSSATSGTIEHTWVTAPAPLQVTYNDLSTDKDLVGKIAGNDPVGQHEDWSTAMTGWPEDGVTTPASLVRHWFDQIDAAALDRADGTIPNGPDGMPVEDVFLTADGLDLRALLYSFLQVSVAFSQTADDYVDDDLEDKGLNSDNTVADGSNNYTVLEHAWDEGFGYWGAPVALPSWTDAEGASLNARDLSPADGAIDLEVEVMWPFASLAHAMDLKYGIDLSGQVFEGFREGRALITAAGGELGDDQRAELVGWRNQALDGWETLMALVVVEGIDQSLGHIDTFGTPDFAFDEYAEAWSTMKGFSMGFQFNRLSPLTDDQQAELADLIGTRPILPGASAGDLAEARADLDAARALLVDVFDLPEAP